jgi:hypothetical protein
VLDLVVPLQHVELDGQLAEPGQRGDPVGRAVPLVQVFAHLRNDKNNPIERGVCIMIFLGRDLHLVYFYFIK